MVTRERPVISSVKEYNDSIYTEARRNRLFDCFNEYNDDDDASILTFYNDLKDAIEETIKYHSDRAKKSKETLDLVFGRSGKDPITGYDYNPFHF